MKKSDVRLRANAAGMDAHARAHGWPMGGACPFPLCAWMPFPFLMAAIPLFLSASETRGSGDTMRGNS